MTSLFARTRPALGSELVNAVAIDLQLNCDLEKSKPQAGNSEL